MADLTQELKDATRLSKRVFDTYNAKKDTQIKADDLASLAFSLLNLADCITVLNNELKELKKRS